MNRVYQKLALACCLLLSSYASFATGLSITGVTRSATRVTFTINWRNSWRASTSPTAEHDAAWVFVKFRECSQIGAFNHALLSPLGGHTIPLGLELAGPTTAPHNTGVMLRKTNLGPGNVGPLTVTLNLSIPGGTQQLDVRVFGVEMVFIPGGSFEVGDWVSGSTFFQVGSPTQPGGTTPGPYRITSNAAIPVGTAAGQLSATGNIPPGNIPLAYPKGFNAFYCMKYEITQQQMAEFYNSLSFEQALNRVIVGPFFTYTIQGDWPELTAGGFPDVAAGVMGWEDLTAYLDWAALRPMTELEFEKVCRGPAPSVPYQYPWGNNSTLNLSGNKTGTAECASVDNNPLAEGVCNWGRNVEYGTLRVGFLGRDNSTGGRTILGAGFYGNLEMAGNAYEQVVSTLADGLNFTNQHGDGALDVNGFANGLNGITTWPSPAGFGRGYHGGAWFENADPLRVSERSRLTIASSRYTNVGGRGCRQFTLNN